MGTRVEVLISTMDRDNLSFLEDMNLQTDVVVGNQNGTDEFVKLNHNHKSITQIMSSTRGLANNRNLTLKYSQAEFVIFSDDDLVYLDNYENIIISAFEENPDADIIIFNLYEDPLLRFVTSKKFKVNFFNFMRFGAVRIACRRESILKNNMNFDKRFGSGSEINIGEDTIFLRDALVKGLVIIAVPEYILRLTNERESTWFSGYNEQYFYNKGKLYCRLSTTWAVLLCVQDTLRHSKKYKDFGSSIEVLKWMLKGLRDYRRDEATLCNKL